MGRVGTGEWFQDVRRVAEKIGHDVPGPQLTAALVQDRPSLSLAMARRLSSAYQFAVSMTADPVFASIAVCEQLQVVSKLDPSAMQDVLAPALAGRLPLSNLQALASSVRARLSAVSADSLLTADLVELCPERREPTLSDPVIEYYRIRDDDRVSVDAAIYSVEPVELSDHWRIDYDGRWAMLVSPHIKCAKIRNQSHDAFISRILIAIALYARVSVLSSSAYEHEKIEAELRRPRIWNRVWVRHLDDRSKRES